MMEELERILKDFDKVEIKGLSETDICSELKKITHKSEEELPESLKSELIAFELVENYTDDTSGWGTYYGPMFVLRNDDGTFTESPSIKLITPEMIDYWEKRSLETINPILTSRYCDLVWTFKKKISDVQPSVDICKRYIHSVIKIANEDYNRYVVDTYIKLERALNLSIGLKDVDLVNTVKATLMSFENRNSQDSKPGLWGYCFDLLINNKHINLLKDEENKIISELEEKLARLTNSDHKEKINLSAAEIASIKLAHYYRKNKDTENIRRVLLILKYALEKLVEDMSAMQISFWIERLHLLFKKFNLNDEAKEILLELREIGPKVTSEMTTFSKKIEIPKEELDAYIQELLNGDLNKVFYKITSHFIPKREEIKKQLFDLSKAAPLSYLISQKLQDEKGRIVATIGSIENDLEGHIVKQISDNLAFSSFFLNRVIMGAIDKFNFNAEIIIDYIYKSPIISENRYQIFKKGLDAYFSEDYLTAIHILIPQIEDSIRNIIEYSGGNVLKYHRDGSFRLRTFDDVLRDEILLDVFGIDITTYFRVLFTDQRGWNMRNSICHGLVNHGAFNFQTADRVLHSLLCLGLVQNK